MTRNRPVSVPMSHMTSGLVLHPVVTLRRVLLRGRCKTFYFISVHAPIVNNILRSMIWLSGKGGYVPRQIERALIFDR